MSEFLRSYDNKYSSINESELNNLLTIKKCKYIAWAVRKKP